MEGRGGIVFTVLILSGIISQISGDYELNITVHSYSNPTSRRNNGRCCDISFWWRRCNECDNYFTFCLRPAPFPHKDLSCPLGTLESGEVGGDLIPEFGDHVGVLSNPFTISVSDHPWTGTFQLRVDVFDDDTHNPDDFVDEVFAQPQPLNFATSSDPLLYTGLARISRIELSFLVQCSENFYGPQCTTSCTPTQTAICNSTGIRECKPGYFNPPECLTFCEPRNDDALGHFMCDEDGSIQCLPNYYGTNCTAFCVPQDGRYTCDPENGTRICSRNYFGEDCEVFCKARNDDRGHYSCNEETGERECLLGYVEPVSNCTELAATYRNGSGGITTTQVDNQLPLRGSRTNTAAILGTLLTVIVILGAALVSIVLVILCKKFRSQSKIENDDLTERMLNGQPTVRDGIHNASYDPMAVGTFNPTSLTQSAEVDFHNPLYHSGSVLSSIDEDTREDLSENNSINSGSYSTIDHRPLRKSWALRPPPPNGTYSRIESELLDSS